MSIRSIRCAFLSLALVVGSAMAQPDVAEFTVFVDPPTGFAFVKLPDGWKFVGQVGQAALARLPATVVTALLPFDEELAPRLASLERERGAASRQ